MIVTLLSSCKKLSPLHPSVIIYILPLGFGAGVGFMLGPGFGAYCKLKKKIYKDIGTKRQLIVDSLVMYQFICCIQN